MKFSKRNAALYAFLVVGVAMASAAGGYIYGTHVQQTAKNSASEAHGAAKNGSGYAAMGVGSHANSGQTLQDLLNKKGKPDLNSLADWAKNLSPADRAAAFAQLEALPAGGQRDALLQALIGAWASSDPAGFLAATDKVTSPKMREAGVDAAIKAMAAQDPQAALQWLKDNPGQASNSELQSRYAAAIAGYASTDPQGALNTVTALAQNSPQDAQLRNAAMQSIANAMADQGKYSDALTLFGTLPAGGMQNQAYSALTTRWAADSPTDASAWVTSLTDPRMRANLGNQVASTWAQSDPQAAASWALQMDQQTAADPNLQNQFGGNSNLLANAVSAWASYDLAGTGQFLNTLPASPDKDAAVATFALDAAQEDPASAMQWVGTITDPQMQQRLAMATAIQWAATDPAALQTYMANSTVLTPDQVAALSNIPPYMGYMLSGALGNGGGGGGGAAAWFGGGGGGGGAGAGGGANAGVANRLENFIVNGTGSPLGNPRMLNALNSLTTAMGGPSVITVNPQAQGFNPGGPNQAGGPNQFAPANPGGTAGTGGYGGQFGRRGGGGAGGGGAGG